MEASQASAARPAQGGETGLARALSLAISLFIFWVVLSGYFTAFLLGAGAGCALGVAWLARRMAVADREGHPIHWLRAVLLYWPWLVKEIIVSGLGITRIVLSPSMPISPTLVRFRPAQHTSTGLATHANSITLTPGTLTVAAEGGEFLVHGLTFDGARACVGSAMDRRLQDLEGTPR